MSQERNGDIGWVNLELHDRINLTLFLAEFDTRIVLHHQNQNEHGKNVCFERKL